MANLQKVNLGTPPEAKDGDSSRTANVKANSNVDVLSTQIPLTTKYLPDANVTLDVSYVGKRVGINMTVPGRVVAFPAANSVPVDQCILLWNIGAALTIGFQQGDGSELGTLNRGDWVVYVSDGNTYWHVVQRGRNFWDETVSGNLTVAGNLSVAGVAGNLSATGKLNGLNGANLLLNGSAELGSVGWGGPLVAAKDTNGGAGTFFISTTALTSALVFVSPQIPVGANVPLALSGEIQTNGVSAGTAYMQMQFFDSSGTSLGYSGGANVANGLQWTPAATAYTTPPKTAYAIVLLMLQGTTVNATAYGIAFRRVKVEYGNTPSLNSQEASIAYLGGAPALSGRPTFAGNVPWDSGNFTPFGAFTAYQPTLAAVSGAWADAVATGGYARSGKLCLVRIELKINNFGTAVGCLLGMPFPAALGGTAQILTGRETDVSGSMLQGGIGAGSSVCSVFKYDNTSVNNNGWRLVLSGTYLIA